MKHIKWTSCLLTGLLGLLTVACGGPQKDLESPDGNVAVHIAMKDSVPYYTISLRGEQMLEPSQLGLVRNDADFSKGLALVSRSETVPVEDHYTMKYGKRRKRNYRANQQTYHLQNSSGGRLDLVFRVSNDGVAFRYQFPDSSSSIYAIREEKTAFNFPDSARAWLQPLANVNTGFAQTNPSYEEYYHRGIPVGTPSPNEAGWCYPALFKSGHAWLLITESGLQGHYPGTRLRPESPAGNYRVGFPMEGEVTPGGVLKPHSALPWSSPWRVIAVGSLKTIVESTLGTDVAPPAVLKDTSWIKPGRASWSWAKLKDASVNYDTQKQYVDYAARMGWEYTLVDVNWNNTIGYDRMADLADYAASKGVGLWLWYNSSGSWNQTVYEPKSRLLTHEDRVKEFKRIHEMGIKGIKVDFFGGDGQSMIDYYLGIFRDAADHHLMVNTHGTTLPRGWERTWPNLMTMEAIRGFEFITFEQPNADSAAVHCAMLPFTRNAFDPMDFTPMSLTRLNHVDRKTTSAFELATPILFTSGVQHYAETPKGMEEVPAYVRDFVKQIPVAWDETVFVDGYPGKLVIIARRKGDRWFIGGINGENRAREVSVDLSFLPGGMNGELITDGDTLYDFNRKEITLDGQQKIRIKMASNGGFAGVFARP